MGREFPPRVFAIDTSLNGDRAVVDLITEPENAATFDAHRVCAYFPLEALDDPAVLEAIAAALAGDPEQACFRTSEARTAIKAVQDHFRGEGS